MGQKLSRREREEIGIEYKGKWDRLKRKSHKIDGIMSIRETVKRSPKT